MKLINFQSFLKFKPYKKHSIELKKGWKVELAKFAKQALRNKKSSDITDEVVTKWVKLFEEFE